MKIIPKKSLGQNFLIDNNIINKISEITKIENKSILEQLHLKLQKPVKRNVFETLFVRGF